MALNPNSFRRSAIALVALAGASVFASLPAAGQSVGAAANSNILTGEKCLEAQGAVLATLKEFKGQLSKPFAESIGRFGQTCDLNTEFKRVPNTADDRAWDRLRVRINYIRTSSLGRTQQLANE